MFFIIISALNVSGDFSAHHQELNIMCSVGYCHAFLLSTPGVDGLEPSHTSGREQESMTIPKAAHTVL